MLLKIGCYTLTSLPAFSHAATWDPCRASSDVEGWSLEGVDDIILSYAGQILLIKEGALEACGVNLGQDHLETNTCTNTYTLVSLSQCHYTSHNPVWGNSEPTRWETNLCTIIPLNLKPSLMHFSPASKSKFKPMACKERSQIGCAHRCNHTCMPAKVGWVFFYLVWGKLPLISHHPPQAGHGAKQRHSQPDPQVPLSFGAEHQNHTQRPAKDEERQSGTVGNRAASVLISVPFLTAASATARKGQKKTFMNKSIHFNINNRSLGLSFMCAK